MPISTLVDAAGLAVGTAGNPLYTGSSPAGGATAGAQTSVNSGVASVTILAANTARQGATVTNTDANALLLLLGTGTASATSYTVKLITDAYYEVPARYTGIIKGIWAADGSGAALVTELT